MKLLRTPEELAEMTAGSRKEGKRIGLVPTMGALHEGHMSLIRRAVSENESVIVSVFVNPAQFGPGEDYESYPRNTAKDAGICGSLGAAAVFCPERSVMYPPGDITRVTLPGISERMCGYHRPGHFSGVATVVAKLFNMVSPDTAYFGQKDYQQFNVIERMVSDLKFGLRLVMCPIIREPDGLAMSSRNVYLGPAERKEAVFIYRALELGERAVLGGESGDPSAVRQLMLDFVMDNVSAPSVDYMDVFNSVSLEPARSLDEPLVLAAAVHIGRARLIDNILISGEKRRPARGAE